MKRNTLIFTLVCGLTLLAGGKASAGDDKHWTESTPYYEEDAWYDITEWFDGNNYHRVDPDENSEDNAVSSSEYGYDDRYAADNWYYDYYDTGYTDTQDADNDGFYDSYSRFYDYDGDGVYDAFVASYDLDDDGFYDDVTYYTFNKSADSKAGSKARSSAAKKSERQTVAGEIQKTKSVAVQDTKHMVVELRKEDGDKCLIDLGPASNLSELELEKGDRLTAQGFMAKVGERTILLAQSVQQDDQSRDIERSSRELQGTIAESRTAKIRGQQHRLVVLKSKDKKRLVDLGPADKLSDLNLKKGKQITVTGPRVQVNDRLLILAQKIHQGDQSLQVDRRSSRSNAQQEVSQR